LAGIAKNGWSDEGRYGIGLRKVNIWRRGLPEPAERIGWRVRRADAAGYAAMLAVGIAKGAENAGLAE
jgi:hypothetical protein